MIRNISLPELKEFIKNHRERSVAMTFHSIGDRDAVGSAVALSSYLSNSIVFTPDFITNNAKRMLEYIKYEKKLEAKLPENVDTLIVMDANNPMALGKMRLALEEFKGELLFIDHHAPHRETQLNAIMFNDESFNSTSSITYEVLRGLDAEITRSTAILLLNGIIADSADLQNSSAKTFRQMADLLDVAKTEFSFFTEFFHANIPASNRYQVIEDISGSTAEVIGRYVLVYGGAREHANIAADAALNIGADASVFWVAGRSEGSVSARLRSPLDKELSLHLGVAMEEIGKMLDGTGGGHACAAGAYGPRIEMASEAGNAAVRAIREKMQARK